MTALMVTGGLLFLLLCFLLVPIKAEAAFDKTFSARVKYLFLQFPLYPRPEKKPAEAKPGSAVPKKKKPSRIMEIFQKEGLSGFLELVNEFSRVALGGARKLLARTLVYELSLDLTVGGKDAAQTALDYGRVCAVVYPALGTLLSAVRCKRRNVKVSPDFQNEESCVQFQAKAGIRPVFILFAVTSSMIGFIKLYRKMKKGSGHPGQNEKAVL